VLKKEHHERSTMDLRDVSKILRSIPFFNSIVLKDEPLTEVDFIEVSKYLTFEHINAGDYL
jgi:hypothetical protein